MAGYQFPGADNIRGRRRFRECEGLRPQYPPWPAFHHPRFLRITEPATWRLAGRRHRAGRVHADSRNDKAEQHVWL